MPFPKAPHLSKRTWRGGVKKRNVVRLLNLEKEKKGVGGIKLHICCTVAATLIAPLFARHITSIVVLRQRRVAFIFDSREKEGGDKKGEIILP